MAERIDPTRVISRGSGAPKKYPWHEWTDGSCWLLKQGEDYPVTTLSFRAIAFKHAKRHGFTLHTKRVEGGITVQFAPKPTKAETGEGSAA